MHVRNVGWLLGGSVVVYVAVACAAAKNDSNPTKAKDSGVLDAIADAVGLGDEGPVGEVEAGPTGPGPTTTDVVACDKVDGVGAWYAVKEFPGRKKEDLVRGHVMVCVASPGLAGFPCQQSLLLARDGAVAAQCNDKRQFSSVTFVMPPPT